MNDTTGRSVVLTGATGFLGAFLMAALLKRGYRVTVLGRPSKDMTLAERLERLVRWFALEDPGDRLLPVQVDLSKERLGLDAERYRRLCGSAEIIVHCASDTSFAERNRQRVMETNVHGLEPILGLAAESGTGNFHYISTAYAAGMRTGPCREIPVTSGPFTNVYEESKAMAEEMVTRVCGERDVPLSILRPSIVYGHSETGMTLRFNALYYPVKSLLYIRDIYKNDIIAHGGEHSRQWGVSLDDEGILHLPLSVYLSERGTVNLIPVDYFVRAAVQIIEQGGPGGIYHITSDNPPDMATLLGYCERFLCVRGIRAVYDERGKNPSPNPAEELFDRFIEPYRPYMCDMRTFERRQLNDLMPGDGPPSFTYDIFQRCMSYAVGCEWGKALPLA